MSGAKGTRTPALTSQNAPQLRFRYVPFRLSPARYLRFRSRVLTASRAVNQRINLLGRIVTSQRAKPSPSVVSTPVEI
jgi:hypothetical protein